MAHSKTMTTLEWFGATTFRIRTNGLTIFLDTWLDRPSVMPVYLAIDDLTEADYIFISHAHFDHVPGADRLAMRTGAVVIANGEAIQLLRQAGVPEEQLVQVAGGERIPLFTRSVRERASRKEGPLAEGAPGAPPLPDSSLAAISAHIWPSLHCLIPGSHADIPDVLDTATIYTGAASPYACTIDITRGMKYGLLKIADHVPLSHMDAGLRSFADYIHDRDRHVFSHCDGGQLMVNLLIGDKTVLWNAHLGAYEGLMRSLDPKPDVAILGIAGRGNLNGRPFDGSAAQFALNEVQWLDEPEKVIWCLHDESPIKPYQIETAAATELVEKVTSSRIVALEPAKAIEIV